MKAPSHEIPIKNPHFAAPLRSRCADSTASASATSGGASGASRPPRRPRTREMPRPRPWASASEGKKGWEKVEKRGKTLLKTFGGVKLCDLGMSFGCQDFVKMPCPTKKLRVRCAFYV